MQTQTLDAVLTVVLPLLLTSPVWVQAFTWLTAHIAQIKDTRLRTFCLTAVKSVAHGLVQGQLLTADHLDQALDVLSEMAPGVPLTRAQPVLRAMMHDVNTAILQVSTAQQAAAAQQQAAAATLPPPPIVVQAPPVDLDQVISGVLSGLIAKATPPPAPTPLPSLMPVPVPTPATP